MKPATIIAALLVLLMLGLGSSTANAAPPSPIPPQGNTLETALSIHDGSCQTLTGTPVSQAFVKNVTGSALTVFFAVINYQEMTAKIQKPTIMWSDLYATLAIQGWGQVMLYSGCSGSKVEERLHTAFPSFNVSYSY